MQRIALLSIKLLLLLSAIAVIAQDSSNGTVSAIVIGIAQDGGIPQIGCEQKVCKTQRHFISSLVLHDDQSLYLIDPTPDLREQYMELSKRYPQAVRANLFDGIFLTHAHMGHYTGLLYLGKESISAKKIPVYCSMEMAQFLERNAPWNLLISNGNIELHPFESGKPIRFANFTITPLNVPHRKEFSDTHGFTVQGKSKSLLYIPDIDAWEPIRKSMNGWMKKCDYAMLDGTFYSEDELPGRDMRLVPHPTIENSIQFLNSISPFECHTYFIHLNHTNPLLDRDSTQAIELQKSRYRIATEWQEFKL